jgi:MinD-like ATPase involved in chromosome partitioning or flagellar assembly
MIIACTSWRGVGTTTTALLVATCLAERGGAWMIEADPAGGVLAGRVSLEPHQFGGLERVAFPIEPMGVTDAFHAVAVHRDGLRIVAAPADPFRSHACHSPRSPWVPSLHDLDGTVVIDIGRSRTGSPARSILAMADVVLLITSPEVSAAVSTAEWMQSAGRVSAAEPGLDDAVVKVVVVDSPGGLSFAESTLRSDLDDNWGGWLPWEPAAVDLVHRGADASDRRLRRSALIGAASELAESITREVAVR